MLHHIVSIENGMKSNGKRHTHKKRIQIVPHVEKLLGLALKLSCCKYMANHAFGRYDVNDKEQMKVRLL